MYVIYKFTLTCEKLFVETCATCETQILFEIIYTSYHASIVLVFFSTVTLRARRKPKLGAFMLPLLFQALNYVQLQQVTGKRAGFSTVVEHLFNGSITELKAKFEKHAVKELD